MSNAIQQFRITGWPGRLPHPVLWPWYRYVLRDGQILQPDLGRFLVESELEKAGVDLAEAGPPPLEQPPGRTAAAIAEAGEIYLELAAVDLADGDAVLAFVNRFGSLGVAYHLYGLFTHFPGFSEHVLPELEASWPDGPTPDRFSGGGFTSPESLAEFRFGAHCIRDLQHAWQTLREGNNGQPPTWESIPDGAAIISAETVAALGEHGIAVDASYEAEQYLMQVLNPALAPMHPRLIDARLHADRPDLTLRDAPLYSICCLELYNHILEHATYHTCANQTCNRTFVRQTGRAQQGQHRSHGVKYCSNHCARAQAQRQYRQRQRAQAPTSHKNAGGATENA